MMGLTARSVVLAVGALTLCHAQDIWSTASPAAVSLYQVNISRASTCAASDTEDNTQMITQITLSWVAMYMYCDQLEAIWETAGYLDSKNSEWRSKVCDEGALEPHQDGFTTKNQVLISLKERIRCLIEKIEGAVLEQGFAKTDHFCTKADFTSVSFSVGLCESYSFEYDDHDLTLQGNVNKFMKTTNLDRVDTHFVPELIRESVDILSTVKLFLVDPMVDCVEDQSSCSFADDALPGVYGEDIDIIQTIDLQHKHLLNIVERFTNDNRCLAFNPADASAFSTLVAQMCNLYLQFQPVGHSPDFCQDKVDLMGTPKVSYAGQDDKL